jgi:hypothetical protein
MVAPQCGPRDPAKRGLGSGGDAKTAPKYTWGANSPLGGRIFLRKTLLRPLAVRPRAWPEGPREAGIGQRRRCRRPRQDSIGTLTARCGVASSFRKRLLRPSRCVPERGPRGPAKRGPGSAGDAGDRAKTVSGRSQPAAGSHLPFGRDCSALRGLFASSHFAHPSRKAAVAPAETCSGLPYGGARTSVRMTIFISLVFANWLKPAG